MVRLGYIIAGIPMSPLSSLVHFLSPSQQTVGYSSIKPRPMPSKSLPVHHHSCIILPSETLRAPNDRPHKSPSTCTTKLGRSSTALYVRQSLVTQEPSYVLWIVCKNEQPASTERLHVLRLTTGSKKFEQKLNKATEITHRIILFIACIWSCIRNGTESPSRYCHSNAKTS